MPQVASDFSAPLVASHNPGPRARATSTDDGAPTPPFSDLVDAADNTPAQGLGERDGKSGGATATGNGASAIGHSAIGHDDTKPPLPVGGDPAAKVLLNSPAGAGGTPPGGSETPAESVATTVNPLEAIDPTAMLRIALGLDEQSLANAAAVNTTAGGVTAVVTEPASDNALADITASDQAEASAPDDKVADIAAIEALAVPPFSPNPPQLMPEPAPALAGESAPALAPVAPVLEAAEPVPEPVAPTLAPVAPTASPQPAAAEEAADKATPDGEAIKIAAIGAAAQGTEKTRGSDSNVAGSKRPDGGPPAPTLDNKPAASQLATSSNAGPDENLPPQVTAGPPQDGPDAITPEPEPRQPDTHSDQPLGALVSNAAQGAPSPADAVHAVLQANERLAAAPVSAPASQPAAEAVPVPLAGLAVEIAARALSGSNRFEIRLDPPELGRIDVRLDIDANGNVRSRLVVDRVETLDALRRDAGELERALQQAGLKTPENSLQFSLRDQGFAGRNPSNPFANAARLVVPDPELAPADAVPSGYGRVPRAGGGIDIRI